MRLELRSIVVIATLAVAAVFGVPSLQAQGKPELPRVAYVWLFGDGPSAPFPESFRARMAELGWIEGRDFTLEQRDARGNPKELDAIMQELVASKVNLIVAMCAPEAASALRFTRSIPIVVTAGGDPIAAGLTQNLSRPGGNITGMSAMSLELSAKRVALLKEAFPRLTQATALWNPVRPDNRAEIKAMQDAGARLGIKVVSREVRSREELASELDAMESDGTQSILEAGDALISAERRAITERAAKLGVPAMYEDRHFVDAGGLMSYGPNMHDLNRRAAEYVDRILKGAKPGDLPFQQPTRFELIINKKAAKALGVTIPRRVLRQADGVVE